VAGWRAGRGARKRRSGPAAAEEAGSHGQGQAIGDDDRALSGNPAPEETQTHYYEIFRDLASLLAGGAIGLAFGTFFGAVALLLTGARSRQFDRIVAGVLCATAAGGAWGWLRRRSRFTDVFDSIDIFGGGSSRKRNSRDWCSLGRICGLSEAPRN
jgi:hypothetical protein